MHHTSLDIFPRFWREEILNTLALDTKQYDQNEWDS